MDTKGYYKSLGINESASDDEIKKAYRKASLKYHPDRQVGKTDAEKKEAEDKFKEINEAYSVLSDPDKKSNYDQFGDPEGGMHGNFGGFNPFADLFGFGNSRRAAHQAEPGTDIRMNIPLSIEDIFNGCTKKVKFMRNVRCPNCHGVGGSGKKTCSHCNGTGMETTRQMTPMGFLQSTHQCSHCNGKGYTIETQCPTCHGSGFKKEECTLEVHFPPGMLEGYAVNYDNKGNESHDVKGKTGMFLAVAVYDFDRDIYSVHNFDVMQRVYIPYYDLLLGCEYTLELPNKEKKKVTIPSCIKEGKMLRLANMGIHSSDNITGDYYIEVHYQLPTSITKNDKELLEKIKNNNS